MKSAKKTSSSTKPTNLASYTLEAETVPGLEEIARTELIRVSGRHISNIHETLGAVRFTYNGRFHELNYLSTLIAVYEVLDFPVPRPKALLGHQHLSRIFAAIEKLLQSYPSSDFQTFHLAAAGSDSSIMQRIRTEIATHTGLLPTEDAGDLLVRIRTESSGSWQVLIRLTPRPLATRKWRVHNIPGALNASVAHAIAFLTVSTPTDRFLNIGIGSGTILIERALLGPAQQLIGIDIDPSMLSSAQVNLQSAGISSGRYCLLQGDAYTLPLPTASMDAISSDLPFGHHIGSHDNNLSLYPAILREAARVARPSAKAVFITHEIRLFEASLEDCLDVWQLINTQKITLTGLHPRIYTLVRR